MGPLINESNRKTIQMIGILLAAATIWSACLVESSAITGPRDASLIYDPIYGGVEYKGPQLNPIPEELEAFEQQLKLVAPRVTTRPIEQSAFPLEPEMVRKRSRFQRSTGSLPQTNIQKLYEDEEMLKRVLPEMLAQARDKASERALLKLLINASLRTSLGNGPEARSANQNANNAADWMAALLPSSSRGPGELSMSDLMGSDGQYEGQDLYGNSLAKRGSYKPCAFNPVSCGRIRSSHVNTESG